jgi:hypothetical protein
LIFRKAGERSHASSAFLGLLEDKHPAKASLEPRKREASA